jgi:hypothetical protein
VPTSGTINLSLAPSLAQLPVPSFAAPTGFAGRIVFPGTGIDVRSATGDGPFSQLPGVFQFGGAGSPEQPEPPRPTPPRPVLPLPGLPGMAQVDTDTESGTVPTEQAPAPDHQELPLLR